MSAVEDMDIPHRSFSHFDPRSFQVFLKTRVKFLQPAQFKIGHGLFLAFGVTTVSHRVCWRHAFEFSEMA